MRRLGWIKPDDGVRVGGRLLDYECLTLGDWLSEHGVDDVEPIVVTSVADAFHTPEDLEATGAIDRLLPAARELADRGCDAIVWACTSGSFVGGLAWAESQASTLERDTGIRSSSTSLAIVEALQACSMDTVDVLSPYPPALTGRLARFLGDAGIGIDNLCTLDCPTGSASHRIDLRVEVERFAASFPESRNPLLIPDTAVNTLDVVDSVEERFGRPLFTANQITLWHGLGLLDMPRVARGAGTLLERHSPALPTSSAAPPTVRGTT